MCAELELQAITQQTLEDGSNHFRKLSVHEHTWRRVAKTLEAGCQNGEGLLAQIGSLRYAGEL